MSTNGMVWIDLETTGLDADAHILEIGALITDEHGFIRESFHSIVRPLERSEMITLVNMYEDADPDSGQGIVYRMHNDSGLWDEVVEHGQSLWSADADFSDWIKSHQSEYNLSLGSMPMCGNSVWSDHMWIKHSMPLTNALFGHRNIDISSTKELVKKRNPDVALAWAERTANAEKPHRAIDDIRFSIIEFQFYIRHGVIA